MSRSARFFGVATLIYFFGPPIQTFLERYLDWLTIGFVVLLIAGFLLTNHGLARTRRRAADAGGAGAVERESP